MQNYLVFIVFNFTVPFYKGICIYLNGVVNLVEICFYEKASVSSD